MKKKVLAIYDGEVKYVYGLMEYMCSKNNLPFRIHIFTDKEKFMSFSDKEDIECLLVSEKNYCSDLEEVKIPHLIILSESGSLIDPTLHHINKYQPCENIYKEILQYYTDSGGESFHSIRLNKRRMKVIGIYTPIGRCLQTTFAFTLGQILAQNSKALYLNFERYSGLSQLLRKDFNSDIADLMYYFECAKEKLAYRVDTMVENLNGLDYIPPANIYQNLAGIKGTQWIDLFQEMEKCTEYEYLILDLTDGMLDLWDVLRFCDIVYTISRGEPSAIAKLNQYEKTIESTEYVDILGKTRKCRFPVFQYIPKNLEELTKGELAQYVKTNLLPDLLEIGGGLVE